METVEARPWSRHRFDASLVSVLKHAVIMGGKYGYGQFTVRIRIIHYRIIVRYLDDVEMQRKLAMSKIKQML